jgi:hypothetical protein
MKFSFPFQIFLFFVSVSNLLAQTDPKVYVKGTACSSQSDGNCFYNLEPSSSSNPTLYYYIPVIEFPSPSTVPSNATQTYEWTVIGGTPTSTTTQQIGVQWNNTANYSGGSATKTIRVKITFSWSSGSQTKSITSILPAGGNLAQPIEVRYISTPSSITFNGSTLSNGNTLSFPCGTTSKTISVPVVTTDPASVPVTYYFYYPSGWSGPASSSTPSITVTPTTGSGGTISVEAKRSDSNFRTKISITITRQLPSISTVSAADNLLFCNSTSTVSESATGTYADKFEWTPTANVRINGSASAQTVTGSVNIGAVGAGSYTVRAYSTTCAALSSNSIIKYVNYGPPTISGAGQYLFEPTTNLWKCYISPNTGSPLWSVVSGDASIGNTTTYDPYISSVNGGTVQVISTNSCGTSSAEYFTIPASGGMLRVYPNPATDVVTLQLKNTSAQEFIPQSVVLISQETGKQVKSIDGNSFLSKKSTNEDRLEMNVQNLPRGIYFLHVQPGKDSKQDIERIRIKLE